MNYAFVTSTTENYLHYIRAQMRSLERHEMMAAYYLICVDCEVPKLPEVSYPVIATSVAAGPWPLRMASQKARYEHLAPVREMDAICFLDGDMLCANNFMRWFDLVAGTDVIVGVNEYFKWPLSMFQMLGIEFPDQRMEWMCCNAPMFLVPRRNWRFLESVRDANQNLMMKDSNLPADDLFTVNVAAWLAGVCIRIIHLPNYAWSGVHQSYLKPETRLQKNGIGWKSACGEKVYMIHGRWDAPNCADYHYRELEKRFDEMDLAQPVRDKIMRQAQATVKSVMAEYEGYMEADA